MGSISHLHIRPRVPSLSAARDTFVVNCLIRKPSRVLINVKAEGSSSLAPPSPTGKARLTVPTRRLNSQEAISALYSSQHPQQRSTYASFYSSELGGIVMDPALMVVQMDDHMVHRGHGVFDNVLLINGHLYELERHLDRLLASASRANIPLPPGLSRAQLTRTILETAAASKLLDGWVRFYLSPGRGGFGLSSLECIRSSLYVMVIKRFIEQESSSDAHLTGWKVKTSPVPMKAPFFATLKSTDYLPNALCLVDAEVEGYDLGIFVDSKANIAQGPNMNVAVLLEDGTLVVPPFESSLAGITMQRLLELLDIAKSEPGYEVDDLKSIERRHITVKEAKRAREVFVTGTTLPVMPVVQWDDAAIADGCPGLFTLQCRALIQNDQLSHENSPLHHEIPYGYLTGMDL
jgi:4-amino-4-deoxychorismate lyase